MAYRVAQLQSSPLSPTFYGFLLSVLFSLPISVSAAPPYNAIATGGWHACALGQDGFVDCEAIASAQRLLPVGDTSGFLDIVAGKAHTCGIKNDQSIVCWGENDFGQLDVPELLLPVRDIDAGSNHNCVIDAAGEVQCWGLFHNGRLNLPFPERNFMSISVRNSFACAIDDSDMVVCAQGQVGLRNSEPPATLGQVSRVEAYSDHIDTVSLACAIDLAGEVTCWGDTLIRNIDAFPSGPYTDVAINEVAVCAVTQTGQLECQLHGGGRQSDVFLAGLPSGANYLEVEGGNWGLMCVRDMAGAVSCWGTDTDNPPFGPTVLPMSTNLDLAVYSETTVELLWNRNDGLLRVIPGASYEIYRNEELLTTTTNSFSYVDSTLSPGTEYRYTLVTISPNGQRSEPSNLVAVTPSDFQNAGPLDGYTPPDRAYETSGLRADVYWENTVELFWNRKPFPVHGYEIRKDGNFIGFTDGTSYLDSVSAGDDPDYDVIPVSRDGEILGFASISVQIGEVMCL